MTAVDDARQRLRGRRRAPAPPPWSPPVVTDFASGRYVLSWDATLTNCGWTAFTVEETRVLVLGKGTIKPVVEGTGYLGTWQKAERLVDEIGAVNSWHRHLASRVCAGDLERVLEAPSVGGGKRTESSLIAGLLVWMSGDVTVVSATHVSAVLLGDARVRSEQRKPLIREAVIRLVPECAGRDWNEHTRDAMATGLVRLHDMRKAETG